MSLQVATLMADATLDARLGASLDLDVRARKPCGGVRNLPADGAPILGSRTSPMASRMNPARVARPGKDKRIDGTRF